MIQKRSKKWDWAYLAALRGGQNRPELGFPNSWCQRMPIHLGQWPRCRQVGSMSESWGKVENFLWQRTGCTHRLVDVQGKNQIHMAYWYFFCKLVCWISNFCIFQITTEKNPGMQRKNLHFINTTVSSKMLSSIAKIEGLTYTETLTGFKWMANKAVEIQSNAEEQVCNYP